MKLYIDQELKSLIPALSNDEYRLLEESILNEGCRDAIITWNDIIIDGHNRYEICSKHRIPFKTEDRDFESKDKVKEWMIINQFGRRNISNYHRCELALKLEAIIKAKAKEKEHMRKTTSQNSDKSFPIIDTWIRKGIESDWKYLGFHLVQFENTIFEDGKCLLDNKEISEQDLITFLSMNDI